MGSVPTYRDAGDLTPSLGRSRFRAVHQKSCHALSSHAPERACHALVPRTLSYAHRIFNHAHAGCTARFRRLFYISSFSSFRGLEVSRQNPIENRTQTLICLHVSDFWVSRLLGIRCRGSSSVWVSFCCQFSGFTSFGVWAMFRLSGLQVSNQTRTLIRTET